MIQVISNGLSPGNWGWPFGRELPLDISIVLEGEESKQTTDDGLPIYGDGETVRGQIALYPRPGEMIEHSGVHIQFKGSCELALESHNNIVFVSLVRHLAGPGVVVKPIKYDFEFHNVEKPYDSYHGRRAQLRYMLQVVARNGASQATANRELWVQRDYVDAGIPNASIELEVGIEEALHLNCRYAKTRYHLKDAVIGSVQFLLVRIKIKMIELSLVKQETTGIGHRCQNFSETVAKFEILDGIPAKGDNIPIRLFLGAYKLTPTMTNTCKRFSVRYYLTLVLVDEDDRRYYKQEEIVLYRQDTKKHDTAATTENEPSNESTVEGVQ